MVNNCRGLASKINSLKQALNDLKPAVFALQETNAPKLKADNLINYQTFELNRELEKNEGGKVKAGGEILFGALHELEPVLVRKGNDKVECMSVEIKVGKNTILCVTGYGPQITDSDDRKIDFWHYITDEVKSADNKDIGIIIEMNSNAGRKRNNSLRSKPSKQKWKVF